MKSSLTRAPIISIYDFVSGTKKNDVQHTSIYIIMRAVLKWLIIFLTANQSSDNQTCGKMEYSFHNPIFILSHLFNKKSIDSFRNICNRVKAHS